VQFDDGGGCVREGLHADHSLRTTDHLRRDTDLVERAFHQAVEVRCEDHADGPSTDEFGESSMCSGGNLPTLLLLVGRWFEELGEDALARRWRRAELSKQG
jgi:hypothetical protein